MTPSSTLISGRSGLAEVVVASVVVVEGEVSAPVDWLAVVVVLRDVVVGDPESPHADKSRIRTRARGKGRRMMRRG